MFRSTFCLLYASIALPVFAQEEANSHWTDTLHNISLSDDVTLDIGGHARARFEYWDNFGSGAANDDTLLYTRIMPHVSLKIADNLTFFVQGNAAYVTSRDLPGGTRTIDEDSVALQQAWAQYTFELNDGVSLSAQVGRLALKYGNQRLLSPLPWANAMRAFDGARVSIDGLVDNWKIDAFYTQYVPNQKYDFNSSTDDEIFAGIYATTANLFETGIKGDAYVLYRDRELQDETRYTIGVRVFGEIDSSGVDYDVEAAYQTGDLGDGDISAYMFAGELGWKLGTEAPTRVFIGFDYASGSDDGSGEDTFSQLYPLGHKYFGQIDLIGRQNIIDLSVGASHKLCDDLTLSGQVHYLQLADDADSIYNAGGGAVPSTGDAEIGVEVDVKVNYSVDSHLALEAGYSHLFAGDALAGGDDIDFFYTQAIYKF